MHYTENTKKEQIKVTRKSDLEFIKLAGFMKKKNRKWSLTFYIGVSPNQGIIRGPKNY